MKSLAGNPLRTEISRRFAAGVMMAALLVLALVPMGFMPSFGAGGKVAIVICSGIGEKTVLVDADEAPGDHDASSSCPYFLAQSPVPMDAALPVLAAPVYEQAVFVIASDIAPSDIRILSPPARGPPAVTLS